MQRLGSDLFLIYRAHQSGNPDYIFVRTFHLGSNSFDTAIQVDGTTDQSDGEGAYHAEPSLLRDGLGALHAFVAYAPLVPDTYETYSIAPRHRLIPDLGYSGGWSSPGPLASRISNDAGGNIVYTAYLYDISGVYDNLTGTTHFVCEGGNVPVLFGASTGGDDNGLSRTYYRIDSEQDIDGPYELVHARSHMPDGFTSDIVHWPVGSGTTRKICPGNIFAKGGIVLGRETEGPRTLHLVWNIRNTFDSYDTGECEYPCTSEPGCDAEYHKEVQWNYNLYYAWSDDGGDTWWDIENNHSKYVTADDPLVWNDPNFLVYEGDVDQGSERAFDVNAAGYPFIAVCTTQPDTSFMVGDDTTKHPDNEGAARPSYDLAYREWDGDSWNSGYIDQGNGRDYYLARPNVRVDMDGGVWVFAAAPFPNNNAEYFYRPPESGSWSGPTVLKGGGEGHDNASHLYSYADLSDPNWHYIAWVNELTDHYLYLRKLRLTKNLLTPDTNVPSGTYETTQTVLVTPAAVQVFDSNDSAPTVTIRYTTNGSSPTGASPTYPGGGIAVTPNHTTHIKARAFASGWGDSAELDITVTVSNSYRGGAVFKRMLLACIAALGPAALGAARARADVFNMPTGQISMSLVPVKNAGNPGELSGASVFGGDGPDRVCGEVDYNFNIGKYEVTIAQYVQFLNAVATVDDPFGLYNPNMSDPDGYFGTILQRSGSQGNYTYSATSDWVNRPINYVSWGDAVRFVNWLENGQPTGPEGLATTEDGSYFLNGATSNAALMAVIRKPGAQFVLPSEDEWYKVAYHKNDGPTNHYWDYATRSNTRPSNVVHNPDPGNNANYFLGSYSIGPPYYRTVVGEFENSASPYGTFDQDGNVEEWNDTAITSLQRGFRGGNYLFGDVDMRAAHRGYEIPSAGGSASGFRIAYVPEPATAGLLLAGLTLRRGRRELGCPRPGKSRPGFTPPRE